MAISEAEKHVPQVRREENTELPSGGVTSTGLQLVRMIRATLLRVAQDGGGGHIHSKHKSPCPGYKSQEQRVCASAE